MTPAELAAIRERAERSTPGPWTPSWDSQRFPRDGYPWSTFAIGPQYGIPADPSQDGDKERYRLAATQRDADAAFIAAARTDIPALLIEVDRLTERVNDLLLDRGEGTPPEGWRWSANEGVSIRDLVMNEDYPDEADDYLIVDQDRDDSTWGHSRCTRGSWGPTSTAYPSARAAMLAADATTLETAEWNR